MGELHWVWDLETIDRNYKPDGLVYDFPGKVGFGSRYDLSKYIDKIALVGNATRIPDGGSYDCQVKLRFWSLYKLKTNSKGSKRSLPLDVLPERLLLCILDLVRQAVHIQPRGVCAPLWQEAEKDQAVRTVEHCVRPQILCWR